MIYIYITLVAMGILKIADIVEASPRVVGYNSFFSKKFKVNLLFGIVFLIFSVLAGIRYYVGTDYETYTLFQIPETLSGVQRGHEVEFLYKYIIYFGNWLGSYQWIFAITHVIFLFFILAYIRENSKNYSFSVFIFMSSTLFAFSLNGMRQSIATAIFLYAVKYIKKNNLIKYMIFIVIAILFHKSAMIYIPFYLLSYVDLRSYKKMPIVLFITLILTVSSKPIYSLLYKLSFKYGFYSKFFNSQYDQGVQFNWMYFLMLLINVVIVLSFYLFVSNDDATLEELDNKVEFNIQVIALFFSAVSFVVPGAFRMFYMFNPIQLTLVPNMLSKISDKRLRLVIKCTIVLLYIVLYGYLIMRLNQNEILPYQTILNN